MVLRDDGLKQLAAFFLFFLFTVSLFDFAQAKSTSDSALSNEELLLLQEVPSVYGASKYEQKVTAAPSSVTIVTASEIKKFGYRAVADILQSVRGFFTTYDRNYAYVGVRGFGRPGDYNTRVLLLVDGYRVNDSIYDQAPLGTDFPVDVDLIDRVEIIRGPSSSIYGTNAFFGVINVITRRGRDLKGGEVSTEAASFDTYKGRASYGQKFSNGWEALVSGSYYTSAGQDLYFKEFDTPPTADGMTRGSDGDESRSFFSRLSYQDFALEGAYSSREKAIPTGAWGTVFGDSRNRSVDERAFFNFRYEHSFENQLNLMVRSFYGHYDYTGTYIYNPADSADLRSLLVQKDVGRNDWTGEEIQLTKKLFEKHKLMVGAEFREDFRNDQSNYFKNPYASIFNKATDSYNWALYIQDEFQIFSNLTLNAGVRHDVYQTFGDTDNPRVALIYNPFEKTTIKGLYGEAFRAPNSYELFYEDGGISQKAGKDLKPETIRTYELVWEQYVADHLRMSVTGYHYKIRDLISLQKDSSDDLLVFKNLKNVEANGFEVELEGKWPKGIECRLSYCLQEARDEDTDSILTNSPQHMTKLNVIFPLIEDKLFLGTEFRYMSSRKTLKGSDADDVFITNVTLFSQHLMKGLELSAGIYNLFDQRYGDPGSEEHPENILNQDGLNFRIKATYSF